MVMAATHKVVLGCISFAVFWLMAVFPAVPFMPIGRTAGSLLGAVLMVVCTVLSPTEAFHAVDLPILGLLFGTMIVSVYLERADLFKYLASALSWKSRGGKDLLCRVCLLSGLSSALFTNDTVCVVFTEFILKLCQQKGLPPQPFLIALAVSSNIGSAATPIGNPQNLVIAVSSGISFGKFLIGVFPAMALGIGVNTLLLLMCYWKRLSNSPEDGLEMATAPDAKDKDVTPNPVAEREDLPIQYKRSNSDAHALPVDAGKLPPVLKVKLPEGIPNEFRRSSRRSSSEKVSMDLSQVYDEARHSIVDINDLLRLEPRGSFSQQRSRSFCSVDGPFSPRFPIVEEDAKSVETNVQPSFKNKYQKIAVYVVTAGMLAALLAGLDLAWSSLTAAVVLMALGFSDAGPSLDQVSYSLLVFFSGMFITVEGFNKTGVPGEFWGLVEKHARINSVGGIAILSAVVIFLSNFASNVPTVLLLGARVAASAAAIPGASVTKAWLILAWVSTVAGNLTMFGSAANLIVSEQARRAPVHPYDLSVWNHLRFGFPSTLIVIAVGLPLIQG